jgi:DNA topoisomerase-2
MKGGETKEFFTERDFKVWAEKEGTRTKSWSHRWYKGLGTTKTVDFTPYMENLDEYLFQITMDDKEDKDALDLAFNGERADDRKTWLETPAGNFDDHVRAAVAV